MIKINLSPSRKKSNVGGIDYTKIKIVPVIIMIILIQIPNWFLSGFWEDSRNELNDQAQTKQIKLRKLKAQIRQSETLQLTIKNLKAQEENLEKKLVAVKEAISEKKNPASLLLYIAKNVPQNLWITDLEINQNEMSIKGEALDYKSIGAFVDGMKKSIFIDEANILNTSSEVRKSDQVRIENFKVKFIIGRFQQ